VKKSLKPILLCCALSTATIANVCHANDCKEINTEDALADLVEQNNGGKVLKVEEAIDEQGCTMLKVRILVDGTIKAVTIPTETGA